MKPCNFEYVRPANVEETLEVLARHGDDARIIAGGLSLVAMMNFRLVETKMLVDVANIEALNYVRVADGVIEVGAATTQAKLLSWKELENVSPLLAKAMPNIGHFQTRSRGTVGGSVAHSDPSSELPLCLATLGGSVLLRSKTGTREVFAKDFQVGLMQTSRRSDEMVVAVRFPVKQSDTGYAFKEMSMRKGDLAVCAVAAVVSANAIRLGVGGVASKPTVREWTGLVDDKLDEALNEFAWDLEASDDIHGTATYRRQLVRRLGRQTILEARACRN